ncbi:HAD family hydrolase [Natronobacterium gregoryi]|uniref:HAD family hydrolase n=2 Tax=Natronobacterium gregoryi TaxID=44930 RepID=L0AJA2_NATGS|nr:HAD family hydrolase [Natronobacterium gregoryi]AFZ73247.1 haloacid dehalogenase superfamily enzyme, subfamily IA [Natronobacterium gregoryi SP2]ELY71294.1 HAD-superfamily hydrolase [Natronobacterium gregoryi SP2]PLK21654.1 HAD family hydrolase [Natronobacterium gregoryi SP2]SFI57553.1 putative hydrolase of the HAD superfamily [Natronobacterium gregoryi]
MSDDRPKLEAVFWDIGGVILDLESVQRAHAAFVGELCERYDLDYDREAAVDLWRTTVGNHFRKREGTTFRSAREGYANGVAELVGERVPESAWKPTFDEYVEEAIEPVPGAVEAVERLADSDHHVGVVSDVDDRAGKRMLESFGIREAFDSITTSEEVGRTKPDPEIFEVALEKAEVDPGRALLIGDRYDHDVRGADDVGMHGVAFGTEDGPAVTYRIESPLEVLEIVDEQ